ncbi:GNAT family N-acetyltransferase [Oryzihumus sp.]
MVTLREVVVPAPREAWVDLLGRSTGATATQTPDWLECICASGPWTDASRWYRFDDGREVLLPLARRRHLPAALSVEASWPFDWSAGGPVTDGPVTTAHTRAVFQDLLEHPALQRTVRLGALAEPAWRCVPATFHRTTQATHVLDLSGGFDHVWGTRFQSSVRRAVRKAEQSGLQVEVDRTGRLVGVFNELYRASVARWAQAQHEPQPLARWRMQRANPPDKFRTVAERLRDRCAVWVARQDERPVAALIVLRQGTQAKYWRGAMDRELASPTRANDLLHRLAIEDACLASCTHYAMGESRPGSGLARFKAGFGAEVHSTESYRTERVPLTRLDHAARVTVKRVLRFEDA